MKHEHALEVAADEVHQAIDFTATAISKKYGLDVERIRSVLERTEYIGRNSAVDLSQWEGDGLYGYLFVPSIAEALDYLQPDTALALFEKEDLQLLKKRVTALQYLLGESAPFYSLSELEHLTNLFILYLAKNRDHIIKTGLPEQPFEKSPILESLLSPLYFVKKPVSSHIAEHKENGDSIYQYIWGSGNDGSSIGECSYEGAPVLEILTSEEAEYLSKNRRKLFVLKIELLKELLESLQSGEITNLIDKFLSLVTKIYNEKEMEFYINTDNAYIEAKIYPGENFSVWHRPVTGGITDLLEVIGHYQKELYIGTFAKTKEAMGRIISLERSQYEFKNLSRAEAPYFKYVALGLDKNLDKTLDLFLSLQSQEGIYWTEYRSRVRQALESIFKKQSEFAFSSDSHDEIDEMLSLSEIEVDESLDEFCVEASAICMEDASVALLEESVVSDEEVTYITTVAREHANELKLYLGFFAEYFKRHIEAFGQAPKSPPFQPTYTPTVSENVFRNEGEFWRITFKGDSITLKDVKGLSYIACLLSTPEKEFHVFELIAEVEGMPAAEANEAYSKMSSEEFEKKHNLTPSFPEDAGDEIDLQTKNEILTRLKGLHEDFVEAKKNNDLGLMSKYKEEIEYLKSCISQGYSTKKGKSRKAADSADKARKAVTMSIRRSLDKIQHDHPSLGRHLDNAIQRGLYCSYSPEAPIEWSL
jgi:hypothetical protein